MPFMQYWFDNTRQQIQKGETLIANSVAACAERWQAAIRQMQPAPMDLAEILRTRGCCKP
jgi:hypothetical protein